MKYHEEFEGLLTLFSVGDTIKTTGFLVKSPGKDVVVFIHGMGGNFYKEGFLRSAYILKKMGISYFSFNTRGAEIVKDFRDVEGNHHLMGTAFEKFEDCIKDIEGALNYLQSFGYENIHLMGHSTGCQKILYYAYKTRDERIKSLIHISPANDYEIWKNYLGEDFEKIVKLAQNMLDRGEGDRLLIPLYEKTGDLWSAHRFLSFSSQNNWEARMFNYENLSIFSQVKIPTFVALGTEDKYFFRPVKWYANKLKDAYRGEKLRIEIMPGDHSFHGYEEELFHRILNFIGGLRND